MLDGWSRVVREKNPESAEAWLAIGLARLGLARLGAYAKEGPLQPIGSTYALGAAEAFMRVLALDSTESRAAVKLPAALSLVRSWVPYTQARDALRRTAGTESDHIPSVLLARAGYERETGERDSTIALLLRYLKNGGDSAVGELELAREYYAKGDTADGAVAYAGGARVAGRTPEGREAYRSQMRLVASPGELTRFDSLPGDSLGPWIEQFWSRRDAETGRADGERLAEHFRRYEYAMTNFRAIVRRPPGAPLVDVMTADVNTGALDSITEADALSLMFGDSAGGNTLLPQHQIRGAGELDPRGSIYIRHGPPDDRAGRWWAYHRAGGNLYLLVVPLNAMLPGTPCDLDIWFCIPPTPRLVQLQKQALDRMAETALRSDEYWPSYRHTIHPTVQVYAMQGTGKDRGGRLLVVFAVPQDDLANPDTSNGFAYSIHLYLVASTPDGSRRADLDTLRTFVTPRPLQGDEYLTGLLELPVPPGLINVRLTIAQPDSVHARPADARPEVTGDRGALVGRDSVRVPAPEQFSLSDPILGRSGSGLVWHSPEGPVPLNPLGAFPTGARASLYYEAAGLLPGATYRQQVAITPAHGKGRGMTLSFTEPATAPRQTFLRALILKDLRPGRYTLTVTLEAPDGARIERTTPLNVSR